MNSFFIVANKKPDQKEKQNFFKNTYHLLKESFKFSSINFSLIDSPLIDWRANVKFIYTVPWSRITFQRKNIFGWLLFCQQKVTHTQMIESKFVFLVYINKRIKVLNRFLQFCLINWIERFDMSNSFVVTVPTTKHRIDWSEDYLKWCSL